MYNNEEDGVSGSNSSSKRRIYKICGKIDRPNCSRQNTLDAKRKFEVKKWSFRVNRTVPSTCMVAAWLTYKHSLALRCAIDRSEFNKEISKGLIEIDFDDIAARITGGIDSIHVG